ncbi:hypothetical protein [Pseudaestuariivita rosea]|uniref:hypothetical protein n=1 Tax=Pseudaestuariivita rosea TaxID=2763263 RepID=UPI001ABB5087|nr:hypothetical protein [Pseudaestuariivita rosea]
MHTEFTATGAAGLSPKSLLSLLGTAKAPNLIDVCLDEHIAQDPYLIPSSRRMSYLDVDTDRPAVVICQKGLKLSQGVAALLRHQGRQATFLQGGQFAWRDLGYPRIALQHIVSSDLWVTSEDDFPKRALQFWTLKRWISPTAKLIHIPDDQAALVGERFEAGVLPPDHTGADLFNLDIKPLQNLEKQIMGGQSDIRLILRGLEVLYDKENKGLKHALTLLDAAYAGYRSCQ